MKLSTEQRIDALAGMLLRQAYLAKDSTDWDEVADRVDLMDSSVVQAVRDTIAEELRSLRGRLKCGENVLNELDRKLAS